MSNKSNKYSRLIKIFKKKKSNIAIIRWMKKNDDKNDAS